MGGLGSGDWYSFREKDLVEEHPSVDVRRWQKKGLLVPGSSFRWSWRRGGMEDSVDVVVLKGVVEFGYFAGRGNARERVRYEVPLARTPCNFGGSRSWFVCPGVVDGVTCDRRAAKLYLKESYFLCRRCHDLAYSSQYESFRTTPIHRAQRIRRRLGAPGDTRERFPPKPKGMHLKTYERLWDEYLDAMEEHLQEVGACLEKNATTLIDIYRTLGIHL